MGYADNIGQTNRLEQAAAAGLENKIPLLQSLVIGDRGKPVKISNGETVLTNTMLTQEQITGRGFDADEVQGLVKKGYLTPVSSLGGKNDNWAMLTEKSTVVPWEDKNTGESQTKDSWYHVTPKLVNALQTGAARGADK